MKGPYVRIGHAPRRVMDPAMRAAVEAELERRREQEERFAFFREEQRLALIEYDIKTGHVRQ